MPVGTSKEVRRRRKFTDEEKAQVVRDALRDGNGAAARIHGVHACNVSRWVSRLKGSKAEKSASPEAGVQRKRRAARRYTPSQVSEALEYAAAHGVSAAAKKLGMSRFTIHEWRNKVERAKEGEGSSPTSGPDPLDMEARRDAEIIAEWKKHPGLGPSQIRNQLRRGGIKVSVRTVRRVMEDAGYRPPAMRSL